MQTEGFRQYLAEAVSSVVPDDAELACACIKRGRIFLEDPVKTIASIRKETFRSDGTAFWPDISEKQIAERMWEAQIKVVFPIIEKQRSIIVERYRKGIEALLPITGAYGEMFFDAEDVEIGVLSHLVSLGRLVVAFEDGKMIARLRNARNTLAHIKPMTQAEIDEALDNLASLGLEGEVYERAKRMLLLELAGSETVLDAWLEEQENGKKKKATVSALDKEEDALGDLEDLDEDDLERELEIAMDEDFVEEELEEDSTEDSKEPTVETIDNTEETGVQDNTDTEEVNTESVNTEPADQEDSETPENSKDSKESERSAFSDDEDEKVEDETVQKDVEKESETAEYISESEHTIQVEKTRPAKEEKKSARVKRDSRSERSLHSRKHKNVVKRKEKAAPEKEEREFTAVIPAGKTVEEKEFQVSVRNPFVLKNSASFMDKFEEYIVDTQENRKLSTGFKRLDAMLRYGLHKGSYFVDSMPQYLKNGFMQQIADRAAESGVDVLYISTELSRYDLMVDTVSRLSYEMNKKDEEKAVSSMAIMTGEKGADIRSLKDELNWYRGRISEHLFVLDQEAVSEYVDNMEDASASDILEELIRSIVTEGAHKPVVFIDNIENILSVEDSEDMKPLMDGIRKLAKELGIPILMSYGYAQAESESELDPDEIEFHESLGNMCDVYLELKYADMITEDYEELTEEDIEEMVENGEMLLINVLLHKNRRTMKASCQIQATPKFNYYEE